MNRLADATSPYLRQHKDNPVDWYPWGDEAFARARELDRPLLISIGYSACHWCHVMAHESFEDEAIATYMNEHFVAIKVDREERPDVDAIYMEAVSAMTGQGGWPLNMFTTPDGRPFYGGTYFPPSDRPQMPSFATILRAVDDAWVSRRDELTQHADELTAAIERRVNPPGPTTEAHESAVVLLDKAIERFEELFDPDNGGIGGAPKFPQGPMLELLLRAKSLGKNVDQMIDLTLLAMASGGIYDHLGGGFARYSVDQSWQVPHFEKMLYDQASLARVYLHAWQLSGDERFRQVVDETLTYVLRDLANEHGAICSSEDADSEGEEGKFYVFTNDDLIAVLGNELADKAADWYGVSVRGNLEHGATVLHRARRGDLVRPSEIEVAREQLLRFRNTRVRPGRDDKVLTEWNAMIGSVLCEAADATGNDTYAHSAITIGQFLLDNLRRDDGRWMRSWRDGHHQHLGVATDYAWLVDLFTRLGTTTGRAFWTEHARLVANSLIELFSSDDGGLFTVGSDAEQLVVRARETYDGVTPSANSVAANAFVRLGALTGDANLIERAQGLLRSATPLIEASPLALSSLLQAALSLDDPPIEIVITGERADLVTFAKTHATQNSVLAWGEQFVSPLWEGRADGFGYVCRFGECLAPVDDVASLDVALKAAGR